MATVRSQNSILDENLDNNKRESVKSNKISSSGTNTRRALKVLQPTASTQTSLVGGKVVAPSKDILKKETKVSSKILKEGSLVNSSSELKTRDAETQTDLTGASGKLDHAEEIAWITTRTGSAESIRKVIEKQISEIEELMAKNEEIHQENAQLKIQIEENRLKNAELLKIVQEIGESYNLIENTFRAQ